MSDAQAPILYSFRRCPYAMRARLAIAASGAEVRLREILLRDKPQDMLAASPKGTVPVLVLNDGQVIDESLDVMRWALAKSDPHGWLDTDESTASALITMNDGPFKRDLDRYKYSTRYPDADRDTHRAAGKRFVDMLDKRLSAAAFLLGEKQSFADIAIFPFVRQFRIADQDWFDGQDFLRVQDWLQHHIEHPLFLHCMKKHPLWIETGDEIAFP
ncbi:MAG: glutathione S-transferase [Pseudomonadota bacterium]